VNELCNDRRSITAPTALILARVFGNSADFWLNVQRRTDLWETMNSPQERERIARARSLKAAGSPRKPSAATLASDV
jgi:plasmid maintenance system antidote protein VapI